MVKRKKWLKMFFKLYVTFFGVIEYKAILSKHQVIGGEKKSARLIFRQSRAHLKKREGERKRKKTPLILKTTAHNKRLLDKHARVDLVLQ